MRLKPITKYKFRGAECSLKEIQGKLQDIIGEEVIDQISKECEVKHKDVLKILDILTRPATRDTLMMCYSVEVESFDRDIIDDKYEESTIINVLDINFNKK